MKDKKTFLMRLTRRCTLLFFCLCSLLSGGRTFTFSDNVLAKGCHIEAAHEQITEAYSITKGRYYQDQICAYASAYYRISVNAGLKISIISGDRNHLIPKLLSEEGGTLQIRKQTGAGRLVFIADYLKHSEHSYVFLELYNHSVSDIELELHCEDSDDASSKEEKGKEHRSQTAKPSKETPQKTKEPKKQLPAVEQPKKNKEPKKQVLHHKATTPTKAPQAAARKKPSSSNSAPPSRIRTAPPAHGDANRRSSSSARAAKKELRLQPHSIMLRPGQKMKLSVQIISSDSNVPVRCSEKDLIWLSTSEDTVTALNGTLIAKKPGTAILCLTCKHASGLRSSALIRVYDE